MTADDADEQSTDEKTSPTERSGGSNTGHGEQVEIDVDLDDDADHGEDDQQYVDRDNLDFDPDEGFFTGTAVTGGTSIPGPHEQTDDVDPNEVADDGRPD